MEVSSDTHRPAPVRRVERVRHELRWREVSVASVAPLGASFIRIVFAGESLDSFVSLGFDDHVKFMFGDADGYTEPVRRDYTPRAHDADMRTLTIDFAVHGGGAASDWARQAVAGQRAVIGGPRGSMVVPSDYAWHLFVGDVTAVPAIARRLGELPAGTPATVIVQLPDEADLAALDLPNATAQVSLQRVDDAAALVAAVQRLALPPGEGYAWAAGEAASMARVRDELLLAKQHPREAMRVAAYWKQGASDYHDELGR